jgi:hypothetical protein
MPKAASKTKKVKSTKGDSEAASGKLTFACACIGGCKGRKRQISEALYKKHAEFRELEDPLQDEQPQANESVSFRIENLIEPHLTQMYSI